MTPDETIAALQHENRILRGLIQCNETWFCPHGVNHQPNIGFCPLGFPGCACADDRLAILCEEMTPLEERIARRP